MTTPNLFGIDGLTVGGLGVWGLWLTTAGALAAWWIRGMPERKRAENEAIAVVAKVDETANDGMYKRMLGEIARLDKKVTSQGKRIDELERELGECHRNHENTNRKLAEAAAEILKLKAINDSQGEVRQRAQRIVAVDRLEAAAEQKEARK